MGLIDRTRPRTLPPSEASEVGDRGITGFKHAGNPDRIDQLSGRSHFVPASAIAGFRESRLLVYGPLFGFPVPRPRLTPGKRRPEHQTINLRSSIFDGSRPKIQLGHYLEAVHPNCPGKTERGTWVSPRDVGVTGGQSAAEEAGGPDTHQGRCPCSSTIARKASRRLRHASRRLPGSKMLVLDSIVLRTASGRSMPAARRGSGCR